MGRKVWPQSIASGSNWVETIYFQTHQPAPRGCGRSPPCPSPAKATRSRPKRRRLVDLPAQDRPRCLRILDRDGIPRGRTGAAYVICRLSRRVAADARTRPTRKESLHAARAQVVVRNAIASSARLGRFAGEAPLDPGRWRFRSRRERSRVWKPVQHAEDLVPGHLGPSIAPMLDEAVLSESNLDVPKLRSARPARRRRRARGCGCPCGPGSARSPRSSRFRGSRRRGRAEGSGGPRGPRRPSPGRFPGFDQGADASSTSQAGMARGVRDGLLADALSLAPVAEEEDRRRAAPVRDIVDSIGHGNLIS